MTTAHAHRPSPRACLLFAALALAGRAEAQQVSTPEAIGLWLGAGLSAIAVHEVAHAATAYAQGWTVHSVRPYPNRCGGKWVGGCVTATPDQALDAPGGRGERIRFSASGSIASTLAALALAPLIPKVSDPHLEYYLERTVLDLRVDFPMYVVYELLGYGGDWSSVSSHLGIPKWALVPVAALHFYATTRYVRAVGG